MMLVSVMLAAAGDDAAPRAQNGTLVRGEVVDAESGRPIPCRVSIRGEDGTWFFPESESAQGTAIAYQKKAIGNPAIVEMHTTLSAHPFTVRLPPANTCSRPSAARSTTASAGMS